MIGYTRKVGLRKPELQCLECWLCGLQCEHPDVAWAEIRARRDHKGYRSVPYDQGGLLEPISRTFNAYATPEPVDPATCPHCCCTYTNECCYCDGSRTPLEDS